VKEQSIGIRSVVTNNGRRRNTTTVNEILLEKNRTTNFLCEKLSCKETLEHNIIYLSNYDNLLK